MMVQRWQPCPRSPVGVGQCMVPVAVEVAGVKAVAAEEEVVAQFDGAGKEFAVDP